MIRRIGIGAADMNDIAEQIGSYLASQHPTAACSRWEASQGKSAVPTLGPGLPIWALGHNTMHALNVSEAASLARHRLTELAENARVSHHQILRDGEIAVGFVETSITVGNKGAQSWRLRAVGLLPVAAREFELGLSRLAALADRPTRTKTRILRIPGVNLGVLWLETPRSDQIVVYRKPRGRTGLSSRKVYAWPDFVPVLAKHLHTVTLNSSPTHRG